MTECEQILRLRVMVKMIRAVRNFRFTPSVIWGTALVSLYCINPNAETSLCLFKSVGWESCFGCGIGHAIHASLHFDFQESFQHHIFGVPAALSLIYLTLQPIFQSKKMNLHGF